ncbi:MAG: glycoside hydrolase, partial [Actinobacteria bacterium]|nr:glycoside hydrolase [Actinomycetota bacterium]
MRRLHLMALVASLALLAVWGGQAGAQTAQRPAHNNRRTVVPEIAQHKNYGSGTSESFASAQAPDYLPSSVECSVKTRVPSNVRLDCDGIAPNNEPDIEVDPENPLHMVASSNDYESCCDQWYTSFNGGKNWITGDMSAEGPFRIGSDPVTVFDPIRNSVLHFSLNFICGEIVCDDGDLVVSISTDGGIVWGPPVQIADGIGDDDDPFQLFHDKEWGVLDTNPNSPFYGRAYVTWSGFVSENGNYISSAIYESHSDNGGHSWTAPKVISGSSPLCTFQVAGPPNECDQNQFSVPTIGPNGQLYVAFQNEQNERLWEPNEQFENQYLLVKSTNGGATFSNPTFIAGLEDGSRDYPINVRGRQTLTGYQVRVNSAGNIVAAPNGNLYLTFSDNRNGVHDVDNPKTNVDVFLMQSTNGGATWTGPYLVDGGARDQWFPWVDVNPVSGKVGVIYNNRVDDPVLYHTTLARGLPGSFAMQRLTSEGSD